MPDPATLFEDPDWIAVAKPPGWETVVEGTGGRCLTSALRTARGDPGLVPVHRLDRDTSGVQILARHPDAEQALLEAFRTRTIRKRYLALTVGAPRHASGTVDQALTPWKKGRRPVRVAHGRGGLKATSHWAMLAARRHPAVGVMRVAPEEGRTHQIRVHLMALGHAIVGDDNYGARSFNRAAREAVGLRRQALHAWAVQVPRPSTGAMQTVVAPLPEDLDAALSVWFPDLRLPDPFAG